MNGYSDVSQGSGTGRLGATTGTMNTWNGPKDTPYNNGTSEALGTLERTIEAHVQVVNALLQRLETGGVLRPGVPKGEGVSGKAPALLLCSLAVAISGQAARLPRLTEQLAEAVERLDV